MKTVVLPPKSQQTLVNNVSETKYYGAQYQTQKGFVTRQNFSCGSFILRSMSMLTNGNGWTLPEVFQLPLFIEMLVKDRWTVFEFNTSDELMKWLMEP